MFTIRKEFKFEMSHRLVTSFHKPCQRWHGHSYVLELFFSCRDEMINDDGMIIDFAKVKNVIGEYIDSWDHMMVINSEDPYKDKMIEILPEAIKVVDYNPTAELMAKDMYETIRDILPQLTKVRLHETVTGYAEYYINE